MGEWKEVKISDIATKDSPEKRYASVADMLKAFNEAFQSKK